MNIELSADDTYLASLPFFHVNTQSWAIWSALGVGATVVLQPRFSASRFWEVIAKHSVTHISLIPFVIKAAFEQGIPEDHTVKVGVFGLIMPVLEEMMKMRVVAAYGMTELVTHCIRSNPWEHYPDMAMGKVAPGYEYLIVTEDGSPAAVGEMGELWIRGIRGVSVCLEYYGNEEATEKFFDEDGWAHTGDVVRLLEDGNIVYCDRDKDALKVGGENVSAREVEDVIRAVGGFEDIAVVAKSHEMLDMVPVVFVIKADPNADEGDLTEQVMKACEANLADFRCRGRSTSWTSSRPPSSARSPRRTCANWLTPTRRCDSRRGTRRGGRGRRARRPDRCARPASGGARRGAAGGLRRGRRARPE
ncbi:MAG: AMP-binding protein [Microthrixaceae bacterium]